MRALLLLPLLFLGTGREDRFIVLSEFQVWADAAGPHVFEELNRLYLERGRSHVFALYPHYEYFVWDLDRMKGWVDEAAALHAFNVFCIGDDIRTREGYLFDGSGLTPRFSGFLFDLTAYAHERGFLVAVEPQGLPPERDEAHFVPWLETWIGERVPASRRPDIIKLSLEWFGAYSFNPHTADEVEAFFKACAKVNPRVLVYLDSISGPWRKPTPFHRWLLHRFPGTVLSHYLGTDQVEAFRAMGARNLMVQINPSEIEGPAGQFFIYHRETVESLEEAVRKRIRYLSLAGVNYGYSRYNYDLFLEVIRPHLALAKNVEGLRASLIPDPVKTPATPAEVRAWLEEERARLQEARRPEPPLPLNRAGRPAVFGRAPEGCRVRNLAALADGRVGDRFEGAYTDPLLREPVEAAFGRDFGEVRTIRGIRVVPCLLPDERSYTAQDFRLEYRIEGTWRPVPGGVFRDNEKGELRLVFPPLKADALRLVVEREWDDGKGNYRACCQELAVE